MDVLKRFGAVLIRGVADMGWGVLGLLLVAYLLLAWLGLTLTGETALIDSPTTFLYYMIVTISTVGYGDYSPVTEGGQLMVVFFIVPVGIGLFATLLGKASALVISQFTRRLNGEQSIVQKDHIVIVGFNAYTESLVGQVREEARPGQVVALCVDANAPTRNPFLEQGVEYFRAASLSDETLYERASARDASLVVVDVEDDSETNLVCMHLSALVDQRCRITAYVKNQMVGRLLETHCPKVNVIPSLHQKMLVKAALDPGSEEVMRLLVDADQAQTQYSTRLAGPSLPLSVERVSRRLRRQCRASLIAIRQAAQPHPVLNPDDELLLAAGDEVFYIAGRRIPSDEMARYLAAERD
ncbi:MULTISPECIES: potassium channel protein [Halomonas]|uniref:Voltage-gated potassium channel n=1 Tax=Halomonas ventosae TaxID=229007 RepID=A0A4R6HFY4_9GAMM|nr:potassium channel protein [Halomonas ventosae]TDO06886.1 voltage-gated potassium channel [Halomonas ventosae]